ncbi:MAG TPA: hypothetical protein VFM25_01500 [Verrucomicrobiae bacterium]|nr:hypothetical protein [Verrucomicrobiae bacterium]
MQFKSILLRVFVGTGTILLMAGLSSCGRQQKYNKPRVQEITCVNNLKQIGLAFTLWAGDHDGRFPFNVSTNDGGSLELSVVGANGFLIDPVPTFRAMSNELKTPVILICPENRTAKRSMDFSMIKAENVTYRIHAGTNVDNSHPGAVLVVCPVDGNTLYCDGVVATNRFGGTKTKSDEVPLLHQP